MEVHGSGGNVDPLELHVAFTACPTTYLRRDWSSTMSVEERQNAREQKSAYLKSRCAGLRETVEQMYDYGRVRGALNVVYLNMTVRDFLETSLCCTLF